MKRLFVLRHAAARGPSSAPTDFDRPLNERGQKQAVDVGRMMRARNLDFDAIIVSPALRVVETLSGLSKTVGDAIEPTYEPRVYNACPEMLLQIIREADDKFERLLIVGHNPGLHSLLLELAQDDRDGHRREIASGYPTATLAELDLETGHWRDVAPRSGRIVSLVRGQD